MRTESSIAALAAVSCATLLPFASLSAFSGSGSKTDPYIPSTDDLTYSSGVLYLDLDAASSSAAYFEVNSSLSCTIGGRKSTVELAVDTNPNYLTITGDGVTLSSTNAYVGVNSGSKGLAYVFDDAVWSVGTKMTVGDSGAGVVYVYGGSLSIGSSLILGASSNSTGTIFANTTNVTCYGTTTLATGDNSYGCIEVLGGGSFISEGECILGEDDTGNGYSLITDYSCESGGTYQFGDDLIIGELSYGAVSISSMTTVTVAGDCTIASESTSSGELWLDGNSLYFGQEAYFGVTGTMTVGVSGTAEIILSNDSLLCLDGAVTYGSDLKVCSANGFIAVPGHYNAGALYTLFDGLDDNIMQFDGVGSAFTSWDYDNYSSASLNDFDSVVYFDGVNNLFEDSILYGAYEKDIDLTGYTVFTFGQAYMPWAEVASYSDDTGFTSWIGTFTREPDTVWQAWTGWIKSDNSGWLYVFPYYYLSSDCEDSDVLIWDTGINSWIYTSAVNYPYFYCFKTNSWYYYYTETTTPDRIYWSYKLGYYINESTLKALTQ